jgi:hypothetical protein
MAKAGKLPTTAQFTKALLARWPKAKVVQSDDRTGLFALDFNLEERGHRLDGSLRRDRSGIAFVKTEPIASASLAIWLRSLVHAPTVLRFFDEGHTASVRITRQLTAEELAEPFLDET